MTRNRRRKQDTRAAAARVGDRYTRTHRQGRPAPAQSLSAYQGTLHLCSSCAQPAYRSDTGPAHFSDQADGIYCPAYPAASELIQMDWNDIAFDDVSDGMPWPVHEDALCADGHLPRSRFRDYTGPLYVCTDCGQPAFDGSYGHEHFTDQWDGVHCSQFPLTGTVVTAHWDPRSVKEWKARYPCSYPHLTDTALSGHR
ncbi:hypothetical protein [Streptomyces omiyaensis]|uniref:hypothetical protein n=1 Tax=Streptomyces omiyaensis TaxID=68247 RepID=UPI0036F5D623